MKRIEVVLVVCFLGVIALVLTLTLTGMLRVVLTGSMEPTLHPGDVILMRPPFGEIKPGMIVTYQVERRPITHRVVEVRGDMLVTRGDNNDKNDPWLVPVSKVIGVPLVSIPYLGYVFEFIRQPLGLALVVFVPCAVLLGFELRSLVRNLRAAQKSGSKTPKDCLEGK